MKGGIGPGDVNKYATIRKEIKSNQDVELCSQVSAPTLIKSGWELGLPDLRAQWCRPQLSNPVAPWPVPQRCGLRSSQDPRPSTLLPFSVLSVLVLATPRQTQPGPSTLYCTDLPACLHPFCTHCRFSTPPNSDKRVLIQLLSTTRRTLLTSHLNQPSIDALVREPRLSLVFRFSSSFQLPPAKRASRIRPVLPPAAVPYRLTAWLITYCAATAHQALPYRPRPD